MANDGTLDEAKGKIKKAAGDLSGDQKLKNEGRVDEAAGKLKSGIGNAAQKAKDAVNPDR